MPADKWALLDALTHAASDFGLNHRTLGVLRALLTFFPDRGLPATPGAGIVYPSNRVLSERLNGMPESTLRRHLSALVTSGLITRHDSANRKRFARFGGVAFGFDLSPLARHAEALFDAADQALARKARSASLRARIAATRQHLLDTGCEAHDLLERARLASRRKLTPDALERLCVALDNLRDDASLTAEMSANNSQIERHIQTTDKSDSVSSGKTPDTTSEVALSDVVETCREYEALFPTERKDWPSLLSVARRLAPMLGIDAAVFHDAHETLGPRQATTVVLCMLETLDTIRKPGAYLRGLTKRAEQGLFNMDGMLRAVQRRQLSADNLV